MQTDKTNITLRTSNKSGILSSIAVAALKLNLQMSKNWTEVIDADNSRLFVVFDGTLNCSEAVLRQTLESNPKIKLVENISFNQNSTNNLSVRIEQSIDKPINTNNTARLNALDTITEETLVITKKKMTALMGPVAQVLVKSASKKTQFIGELYSMLSEELEEEEKAEFLSSVNFSTNNKSVKTEHVNKKLTNSIKPAASTKSNGLHALDIIDDETLKITEKKMGALMGPVASVLVKSALRKTQFIGELYLILSEELEAEERAGFLSSVNYSTTNNKSAIRKSPNYQPIDTNLTTLNAQDIITEESLKLTMTRFTEFMGPMAPVLVEAALKKTRFIGELYLILAEELRLDEQKEFLSSVSGLNASVWK